MAYEARRRMKYGPGRHPAVVLPGDEIPPPVKRRLLELGWVAEVAEYSGRSWMRVCEERDAAEQERIDKMEPGPLRDRAQAELDALTTDVPVPSTIHAGKMAAKGDYFNAENPQAEPRKPEPPVVAKNKAAIDAMAVSQVKMDAALEYSVRESERLKALPKSRKVKAAQRQLDKWLDDIEQQCAGLQAADTVPAAPSSVAPATPTGGGRGKGRRKG